MARLGSRLRPTAFGGQAATVKEVTVRVLNEAIARGREKTVGCATLHY